MFLGDLLQHMWVARRQVVEVAKAEVDSWGYDVVLATRDTTRYVQLKTSVPVDVSLRLLSKTGACVVATIPGEESDRIDLTYRFWEPSDDALRGRAIARRKVYRRGSSQLEKRKEHRIVKSSEFSPASGMTIAELADALFPR